MFQICEMSDYTRWGEHPTSAGQSVARVPGRVMQRIPLYLNISIWTISIKDTSEIQNIQHRKQIITLTYRCGTHGKMLWAQVSCAAAPARGPCHLVHEEQPPASSRQPSGERRTSVCPPGRLQWGSSELLINIQIVHISTSPHHITLNPPLTRSSSFMTVFTLVVSVEGMEAVGSGVSAWSDSGQLVTSRVNELTFPSPRRQSGAHYAYYFYQTSHYSIISSNRVHCSVSTYRG